MGMDNSGSFRSKKSDGNASEESPDDTESPSSETPKLLGLSQTIEDVDRFLESLSLPSLPSQEDEEEQVPPPCVEVLLASVEKTIGSEDEKEEEAVFLAAVARVSSLSKNLGRFSSSLDSIFNRSSLVLQKAMAFLEEEFVGLLEEQQHHEAAKRNNSHGQSSAAVECNSDRCMLVEEEEEEIRKAPETVARLAAIAAAMISAGYEAECRVSYAASRRGVVRWGVEKAGYEGVSAEEVQKMQLEALEREMEAWIGAARGCASKLFPAETALAEAVFGSAELAGEVLQSAVGRLLGFAEAVVVTRRSPDKAFKLLDMYEALREVEKAVGGEVAAEVGLVKGRVGEAAANSFSELEKSLKGEQGKGAPVPSGAVHPATRYVMNYLEFACAYKETLEEVFRGTDTAFSKRVESVMEVLDGSLEAKSRLYRDHSLNHIFMMNNGRYIVQKIKASAEWETPGAGGGRRSSASTTRTTSARRGGRCSSASRTRGCRPAPAQRCRSRCSRRGSRASIQRNL